MPAVNDCQTVEKTGKYFVTAKLMRIFEGEKKACSIGKTVIRLDRFRCIKCSRVFAI